MRNISSRIQHQPKVLATYHRLLDIIKELEADEKLPTTIALRAQLSVSLDTLNLALRELEQQHLIYIVHGVGIYVSPRRRTCLLVDPLLFHSPSVSPFWQLLVNLIRGQAARKNEDFSFYFAHPASFRGEMLPLEVRQQIESGRLAGVIGLGISREASDWLEERTALVVFAAYGKYAVELDADSLIGDATEELARRGCREIGFWRPFHTYRNVPSARDQGEDVFRDALHELKLEFIPSLTYSPLSSLPLSSLPLSSPPLSMSLPSYQEQGYQAVREVFGRKGQKVPDGIVIGDDMMASGALRAFEEMGIQVGEDVLIASHANKKAGVLPADANIIVFEFDEEEIVQAMFAILNERFQGQALFSRTLEVRARMRRPACSADNRKINV